MKDSGERGFVQAYNAQIAVDSKAQIIVAAELTSNLLIVSSCYHGEDSTENTASGANNHHRRCGLLGHHQPAGSGDERH